MQKADSFWISPHYKLSDFEQPLTMESKTEIFKDRVLGWKLNIADYIINGGVNTIGVGDEIIIPKIPHTGYAVLDIVFSYFEMIAKFIDGFEQKGKSKYYCELGLKRVFPPLFSQKKGSFENQQITVNGEKVFVTDHIVNILYESIRCGLYHSGVATGPVVLSSEFETPLTYYPYKGLLYVNPHILVKILIADFEKYIAELNNPENELLRTNFLRRFDFQDNGT